MAVEYQGQKYTSQIVRFHTPGTIPSIQRFEVMIFANEEGRGGLAITTLQTRRSVETDVWQDVPHPLHKNQQARLIPSGKTVLLGNNQRATGL